MYCEDRFGTAWTADAQTSLRLHAEENTIPAQVVVISPGANNRSQPFPFGTSVFGMKAELPPRVAAANKIGIDRYVRETGSGLNDKRKELARLLADNDVKTIIVEHRDRLARFGVAQIEHALKPSGRGVLVIDGGEVADDLVRDMIDLMACFSARLYGRRSARNRAARAMDALRP